MRVIVADETPENGATEINPFTDSDSGIMESVINSLYKPPMLVESAQRQIAQIPALDEPSLAPQSLKDDLSNFASEADAHVDTVIDCLDTITTFFLTDYGSIGDSETKGCWWEVSTQDIGDELDHYNSWAAWEAKECGRIEEFVEVSIEQLLGASQQRLERVAQTESANQHLTVIYQHLHEMIRQTAMDEADVARLIAEQTEFLVGSSQIIDWRSERQRV